jgi:hypothetical protein
MKKRLFLSSAIMTGVLAVALSTGTYAWYTVTSNGAVETVQASANLTTAVDTYNAGAGTMTLTPTFAAANDTAGVKTAKGTLTDTSKAHSYNGTVDGAGNNVYNGEPLAAVDADPYDADFTLPTYSTTLQDVDLTNSKGHTYANAAGGLIDVTEQAAKPYGAFTFTVDSGTTTVNKSELAMAVAATKVGGTAVGEKKLQLTITVQAIGNVRLSNKEDATIFSNSVANSYTYVITLGSDGTIALGSGVSGTSALTETSVALSWTFPDIYYSVAPANTTNNLAEGANNSENTAHSTDGVSITWSSEIVD